MMHRGSNVHRVPAKLGQADRALMDFTGEVSLPVQGRLGGTAANVSAMQVASFAPTSASGRTNEAFAAISVVLAAILTALIPPAAWATDLPLPMPTIVPELPAVSAPYNWSGFYVGGHLGYLWGRTHVDDNGVTTERNAPTEGIIGGVLAGYNWQIGAAVFGLEGDFAWTRAHGVGAGGSDGGGTGGTEGGGTGSTGGTDPILIPVITHGPNSYDVRWTSRVRGHVGYAFDNWLVFAAGGFAAADVSFREGTITTTFVPAPVSGGKYYGWSAGGGIEWAFTRNLVARVEYFYDDYSHKDYVGVLGNPYRVSLTGQTMRGALAWKFNPFGP
jgi:outer membrane immunogenic protein